MNAALALTETRDTGICFQQTDDNQWTVTVDGQSAGWVERDGVTFWAWGYGSRECCGRSFQMALDKVAERHRWFVAEAERMEQQRQEFLAKLTAMPAEAKARQIEALEAQKERLPYAPAHMDIGIRKQQIDAQIAALRSA